MPRLIKIAPASAKTAKRKMEIHPESHVCCGKCHSPAGTTMVPLELKEGQTEKDRKFEKDSRTLRKVGEHTYLCQYCFKII